MGTNSIKSAAIISIIGKYSNVLIQLIYTAILGRILSPQEFGVVAVITVFLTFFTLVSNMGIGPAIVQNKTINDIDIKSLFALTFYIGTITAALFSLFSYPISLFYSNDAYISIGILLAISLFFNTINIVPNALLLKELKFKIIAFRTVVVGIGSAIPTIYLATIGFSYYSIVIHSILVALITFFWNYFSTSTQIAFKVKKESINKIKEFSKFQFGFSVINYFSRNIDNLLIGRYLGESQLGYYNRSYQLMIMPVTYLTNSITPVLHPILSKHEDNKDYIYKKYVQVLKILSIIGVFVSVFTFFSAREIILILFGSQWEGSIRSLQFLSLSIWAQMLLSSSGSIFQSINKTKLLMISSVITTTITILAIILGVLTKNINIIALLISISYNLRLFFTFYILINIGLKKKYLQFIYEFVVDIILIMVLIVSFLIYNKIFVVSNLIPSLLIKLVYLGTIYICLLLLTGKLKFFYNSLFKRKI